MKHKNNQRKKNNSDGSNENYLETQNKKGEEDKEEHMPSLMDNHADKSSHPPLIEGGSGLKKECFIGGYLKPVKKDFHIHCTETCKLCDRMRKAGQNSQKEKDLEIIEEWWNDETILYTSYYLNKLKQKIKEGKEER
jgi:hypothetical protein